MNHKKAAFLTAMVAILVIALAASAYVLARWAFTLIVCTFALFGFLVAIYALYTWL